MNKLDIVIGKSRECSDCFFFENCVSAKIMEKKTGVKCASRNKVYLHRKVFYYEYDGDVVCVSSYTEKEALEFIENNLMFKGVKLIKELHMKKWDKTMWDKLTIRDLIDYKIGISDDKENVLLYYTYQN